MFLQNIFGCSSANYEAHPDLWLKNIDKFIPFLNILIYNSEINNNLNPVNIIDISSFSMNNKSLKDLLSFYKSDKGHDNGYWPIYTTFLEKFAGKNIRLLEIGLGTNDPNLISTMGNDGKFECGSSLRAFRDYLPNANIFGADVDRNCLFNEERIKTCYVDQLEYETFQSLNTTFENKKFDFIIDDGLHSITANLGTLIFAIQNINTNGIILIEDIPVYKHPAYELFDKIIKSNYDIKKSYFVTCNSKTGFVYIIEK
jgi:hypothetical protein